MRGGIERRDDKKGGKRKRFEGETSQLGGDLSRHLEAPGRPRRQREKNVPHPEVETHRTTKPRVEILRNNGPITTPPRLSSAEESAGRFEVRI